MPKNVQAGQGKSMGAAPGQPNPQALMQMQQLQQMQQMQQMGQQPQGMGMAPPQEMNPVTPMPQIRGRVAPGQGMPPGQFQAPTSRVDPRAFAMQLAQMRAMQQPRGGAGNGIAQYQANLAQKMEAQKAAALAAALAKQKKKPELTPMSLDQMLGAGGDSGAGGGGASGDGGAGSAGAGE